MTSQVMCGEKQIKGDNIQIAMTMKKCILGLLVLLPILNSCKDDMPFGTGPVQNSGDGVVFNLVTEPTTRTMYEDDWDNQDTQALYWGNYLADQGENVKIFCKNAQEGNNVATYAITPQVGVNSPSAAGISAAGTQTIKWGEPGNAHQFYAFYPADKAGDQLLNGTDNTIRATIDQGQDPVGFRVVCKTEGKYSNLAEEAKYYNDNLSTEANWKSVDYQTVIYGKPDMSAAVMVAHTDVRPSSEAGSTWGQEVPLNFKVLADVLDFTINGPVTPNSLGGNIGDTSAERNFIRVQNITVTHKDGKPIVGNFTLNMETGLATDISNGVSTIQMRTGEVIDGVRYNPVLYVRKESATPPPAGETDNLRVRCFLIPGSVQDLSELTVHVQTDCGDFDQPLGQSAIGKNGRIHRVKLGYFRIRGTTFDYSKWMGQLDPDIYISELSIPGTWHSTVEAYQGAGNNNLVAQYNKGIRAFELHAYGAYELNANPTINESVVSYSSNDYQIVSTNKWGTSRVIKLNSVKRSINLIPTEDSQIVNLINWDTEREVQLQALHNAMNPNAFCVVEIGYDATGKSGGLITSTGTREDTGVVSGTCQITLSGVAWQFPEPTSDQIATALSQQGVSVTWTKGEVRSEIQRAAASMDPMFVTAMNNVAEKYKDIIYTEKITPFTTIRNVRNKIILKINTNEGKANETGYIPNYPGLFSRWYNREGNPVLTTAMQWGAPIAPDVTSDLYIVWSTKDNIAALANREARLKELGNISYERYATGNHNTWYEFSTGGYLESDGLSAANCQNVAKDLNQKMIQALTDPSRQACPYGLIMMNYACSDDYYGTDLIRTIINNNAAFYLNRATLENVGDNTNSSFTNNSNNPLK